MRWIDIQIDARRFINDLLSRIEWLDIRNLLACLLKDEVYMVVVLKENRLLVFLACVFIINHRDIVILFIVYWKLLILLDFCLLTSLSLLFLVEWVQCLWDELIVIVIFELELNIWLVFIGRYVQFNNVWCARWCYFTSLRETFIFLKLSTGVIYFIYL
jgi:hypothetical protein